MSEQADCGSADLDTTAYVPFSEHTRKLAEARLSKQRALQACEAELSDLRAVAQAVVSDLAGEMNTCGCTIGGREMCLTCREVLDPMYQRLRAALNPKESA